MSYILVTGGVRSGKSRFAEELAGRRRRVLYVATGTASDGEMKERIIRHQQRRPEHWGLLEVSSGFDSLYQQGEWDCFLIDCISSWVGRVLVDDPDALRRHAVWERIEREMERLITWLAEEAADAVVVTSETGLGGVALTPLGRLFQDTLGGVNQRLAKQASEVYLVVSGCPVRVAP